MSTEERRVKVIEILEATVGGTRRHLFDLVTRLDRNKFDVSVIYSTLRDQDVLCDIKKMRALGITVTDIPMRRAITPLHDIRALWRIWRLLRSARPDVVHTHSSKAGFLGRIAAKLAGTRLIIHSPHVFAFEMEGSDMRKGFFFRLEQFASRLTDLLVCVSPSEKRTALERGLTTQDQCAVVVNGVEVPDPEICQNNRRAKREELGFCDDDIVIGSIARFTRQKGPEQFLSAVKALTEKLPGARFVLIGSGELHTRIQQLIRDFGIANRCIALNIHDDVSAYYPIFDIFVITSLWEGMPYALLEAMAAGRAVAAFGTGGIPDVIADKVNGMLVTPGSVDELVSAVSSLATDPQKRDDLGKAAKLLISENYGVNTMVRHIEKLYMRVSGHE